MNTVALIVAIVLIVVCIIAFVYGYKRSSCGCKTEMIENPYYYMRHGYDYAQYPEYFTTSTKNDKPNVARVEKVNNSQKNRKNRKTAERFEVSEVKGSTPAQTEACNINLNDHINGSVANYVAPGQPLTCANGENVQTKINSGVYNYYGGMYSTELERSEASQFHTMNAEHFSNERDPLITGVDHINQYTQNYYIPAGEKKRA